MADNDKPLRVSATDKTNAHHAGIWIVGASPERNRLRAAILASMRPMACAERRGDSDAVVFHEALEVQRLAVLLAQHIDENGV